MSDADLALVERLFDAFNRRDVEELERLCDERLRFPSTVTAEAVGRETPYEGPQGLHEYLEDTARLWEELLVTPGRIEERAGRVLVRGRVYARSREEGIRDLPLGWVWEIRDGRFVRGAVFLDPEEAVAAFRADD